MNVEKTVIKRYENKYLIDEDTAQAIARRLHGICRLDEHIKPGSRGYLIHSLYFDTIDLKFFWLNLDQSLVRFKPRVRTYAAMPGDPPCPYVWLELKRKVATQVYKTRLRLDYDDWPYVLTSSRAVLDDRLFERDAFLHIVQRYDAIPMTHIRYFREAWASDIDSYVRITFDRHLTAIPANGCPLLRENDPRHLEGQIAIDDPDVTDNPGFSPVILEIKCEPLVPDWLRSIIDGFSLELVGVSKYILGNQVQRTPLPRSTMLPIH